MRVPYEDRDVILATLRKRLTGQIKKFLKERRKSGRGGGWAEIVDADLVELDGIVRTLAALKCECDADGDLPINCILVNRRTHEPLRYRPHRYLSEDTADELIQEAIIDRAADVKMAATALEQATRIVAFKKEYHANRKKDKDDGWVRIAARRALVENTDGGGI